MPDFILSIRYKLENFTDIVFYNPRRFIRNVIDYRKFLVNNRWFDRQYIFDMLKIKLETDIEYYKKYAFSVEANDIIKDMEYCVKKLESLTEDQYEETFLEPVDEKWGEINMEFDQRECILTRKKVVTEEDEEQASVEFIEAIRKAEEKRKQDAADLFNTMRDNIFKWWD